MTLVVTTFLAILTLFTALGVIVVVSATLLGRLGALRALVGSAGLWMAFAVALTATAGSLYLSEVARFVPCSLCWYQRIAMYPLVVILGLAAWGGDVGIRRYGIPMASVGALISAYHVALQRLPGLPSGSCSLGVPCSTIDIERFGFVTIPVMAFVAFVAVIVLLLALTPGGGHRSDEAL